MAKCINTVIEWDERKLSDFEDIKPKTDEILANTCSDVFATERLLNRRLDHVLNSVMDIGNDLMTILNSCNSTEDRWDCCQVQMAMLTKLSSLFQLIKSYIDEICDLKVVSCHKHRYFNYLNAGIIVRLHHLVAIVGRFSDQNQSLFYEDFMNPMTSDQSIFLHSLGSIWSFIIHVMKLFELPAKSIVYKVQFESQDDDYSFLEEMDFMCGARKHARIFLMDLICLSWLKFNHLVKLEDLIKTHPLPCLCSTNRYFATIKLAMDPRMNEATRNIEYSTCDLSSASNEELLSKFLHLVLYPDSKPSLKTASLQDLDIIPLDPPFRCSDLYTRSYFILWHIYSLSVFMQKQEQKAKLVTKYKGQLVACMPMVELCLMEVLNYFRCAIQGGASSQNSNSSKTTPSDGQDKNDRVQTRDDVSNDGTKQEFRQFSPHQEERFALIFYMIDQLTETMATESMPLVCQLLELFDENWSQLSSTYFQSSLFRVKAMTLFQLFTKIITESTKIEQRRRAKSCCATDDISLQQQATTSTIAPPSSNEIKLELIWDKVLARMEQADSAGSKITSLLTNEKVAGARKMQ